MSTESVATPAPPVSLRSRFRTGIAYNTIGALFNQGTTFAVNIIVANLLGRQAFGEYAMTQSTLATLSVVAQFAVGYTATKYIAEFRSTDPQRTGRILGMLMVFSISVAFVAAAALLGLSGWLAESMLRNSALASVLAIGAAVLFFAVVNGLLMGALSGLEAYRSIARALISSGIVYFAVCTGLAWRGGLQGAVVGLAISGLVQFVLLLLALLRQCSAYGIRIRYTGLKEERRILLRFALPAAMSGFLTMPSLWLANTLLVRQPDGYAQMALYSAGFSLMTACLFLPNTVNTVAMSLINHHKGTGRDQDYRRTFWMNLAVSTAIVILAMCLLALFGRDVLRLFGKDFRDGYTVLLILLVATIVQCVAVAMYQVIQSQARMWLSFVAVALPRDSSLVVFAYLLIPAHGAIGIAAAYTAAWTIALIAIVSIVLRTGVAPDLSGSRSVNP